MSDPDAAGLTVQGQKAMHAGRYDDAVRAFARAVQLAPESDGLYFQLAAALLWRGLPTEALAALDHCVRLRGAWAMHAQQMALNIRGQIGLPVHGQMILPSVTPPRRAPLPSPSTTLPGMVATISRIRRATRAS